MAGTVRSVTDVAISTAVPCHSSSRSQRISPGVTEQLLGGNTNVFKIVNYFSIHRDIVLKAIDIWMGTCTAFVFAALVEFTFVNYTWR